MTNEAYIGLGSVGIANLVQQQPYLEFDGTDYVLDNRNTNVRDDRGHLADGVGALQGKLPWHPTFSGESPYSTPATPGGEWTALPDGTHKFTPSVQMVVDGRAKGLGYYMQANEPNETLATPAPVNKEFFNKVVYSEKK